MGMATLPCQTRGSAVRERPGGDSRNRQLERALALLSELSRNRSLTLRELADRHSTTTRTIRRDFDALRSAGFDVEEDADATTPEKRWRIDSRRSAPRLKKLQELRGGRVELTFLCADSPELRGWIARWRRSVAVLEPGEVKAEFRELGRFLRTAYGD